MIIDDYQAEYFSSNKTRPLTAPAQKLFAHRRAISK